MPMVEVSNGGRNAVYGNYSNVQANDPYYVHLGFVPSRVLIFNTGAIKWGPFNTHVAYSAPDNDYKGLMIINGRDLFNIGGSLDAHFGLTSDGFWFRPYTTSGGEYGTASGFWCAYE